MSRRLPPVARRLVHRLRVNRPGPDARSEGDARFIESVYWQLLGRAPEPEALEHNLQLLANGADHAAIVLAVAGSGEFASRAASRAGDDAEFVDGIYRRLLDRPADRGAVDHYVDLLRAGADRTEVVIGLVESEEYEHRVVRRHVVLPDLKPARPDHYRRVAPADDPAARPVPVYVAHEPADYDWIEEAILTSGYYERPGIWTWSVDQDKRLMAEILATFRPRRALDLGCASGAVMECLDDLGIHTEGVEISSAAIRRSKPHIASRIHCADLLEADLAEYDLVYGLDIFEHFNPNRLTAYLKRIADLIADGGFLFANVPAFGNDPVFGTVFDMFLDEWREAARAGRPFSWLQVDDEGYPMHGHLIWAASAWWQQQFEQLGLRRETALERELHERYDDAIEEVSSARRSFYVFSKNRP